MEKGWTGYLWQGRFSSFPMDDAHLLAAARYIELNPVRAGIADDPHSYPWSSAKAHLRGQDDRLVLVRPLLEMTGDWRSFLKEESPCPSDDALRQRESTGRPLGSDAFLAELEEKTGRTLKPKKPGPKPKH